MMSRGHEYCRSDWSPATAAGKVTWGCKEWPACDWSKACKRERVVKTYDWMQDVCKLVSYRPQRGVQTDSNAHWQQGRVQ